MNLVNLLKGLLNLQKKLEVKNLPSQGLFYNEDFEICIKKAQVEDKKTIVDKKRINQIMKRIKSEAKRNKIDYVLVKNFWNKLIQYSIKLERKIVK